MCGGKAATLPIHPRPYSCWGLITCYLHAGGVRTGSLRPHAYMRRRKEFGSLRSRQPDYQGVDARLFPA